MSLVTPPLFRTRIWRLAALVLAAVLCAAALFFIARLFVAPEPDDLGYARIPSPNFNRRPFGTRVNCVVLHATAQPTLEATVALFLDPSSKVSAHFVVGKEGRVVQMVPVRLRAWHAGVSIFNGVPNVNDYSVGIEIVNLNDGRDAYTPAQYRAVADIIRTLRRYDDLPDARIVSHAKIALPPGRKSDPRGFDFARLDRML